MEGWSVTVCCHGQVKKKKGNTSSIKRQNKIKIGRKRIGRIRQKRFGKRISPIKNHRKVMIYWKQVKDVVNDTVSGDKDVVVDVW